MPGNVQHIVDPTDHPEITILVTSSPVAREINAGYFAPVLLLVPFGIAVNPAQHGRPGFPDHQLALHPVLYRLSFLVHHRQIRAEER